MSWYPKEAHTPFDDRPINGLFFVDGLIHKVAVESEYPEGVKCPRIAFPSGQSFVVLETDDNQVWLELFADITVPLYADQGHIFAHLITRITPVKHIACFIYPVAADGVLVWGKTTQERFLIKCNNAQPCIEDVQDVSDRMAQFPPLFGWSAV